MMVKTNVKQTMHNKGGADAHEEDAGRTSSSSLFQPRLRLEDVDDGDDDDE